MGAHIEATDAAYAAGMGIGIYRSGFRGYFKQLKEMHMFFWSISVAVVRVMPIRDSNA